jgi:hypothetical protein
VPFIRHTKDKRGYESTYVMHAYRPAQGPGRTRVLYLFRSPAHVRIGRRALDEEAREALTHTHPDLLFDWAAIARESGPPRQEAPSWPPRREARQAPPVRSQPAPAEPRAPAPDDPSVLGQALGAEDAARLRGRYSELMQRIVRRARTPEDRDRLTVAAVRLNPEDWADVDAAKAAARTIEADWDAILAELPSRRRGRRGGRRRHPGESGHTTGPEASAIMVQDGDDFHGPSEQDFDASPAPDRTLDAGGDGGAVGAEPGAGSPELPRDDFPVDD